MGSVAWNDRSATLSATSNYKISCWSHCSLAQHTYISKINCTKSFFYKNCVTTYLYQATKMCTGLGKKVCIGKKICLNPNARFLCHSLRFTRPLVVYFPFLEKSPKGLRTIFFREMATNRNSARLNCKKQVKCCLLGFYGLTRFFFYFSLARSSVKWHQPH